MISTNSDTCAIGIVLLETDFTDNGGVCDILATIGRDISVTDDMESVSDVDFLTCAGFVDASALAQPSHFIG